jgi:hypothetical protein
MNLKCLTLLPLLTGLFTTPANGAEAHFAVGFSDAPISSARVALRSDELNNAWLPEWLGAAKIFVEPSVNHIRDTRDDSTNLTILGLSPVLQWKIWHSSRPLFIEAGIGASFMDRVEAGGRNFSTSFQFEDMLRLSWQYDPASSSRLTAAYVHYSNAGISRPNDGISLFQLSWAMRF